MIKTTRSIHDQIAEKLAKKFKTVYKKGEGIDLVTNNRVIEVETPKKHACSRSKTGSAFKESKIFSCE